MAMNLQDQLSETLQHFSTVNEYQSEILFEMKGTSEKPLV